MRFEGVHSSLIAYFEIHKSDIFEYKSAKSSSYSASAVQSLIKSPSATLLSCRSHTLSIMEDIEFFSPNDYTTLCSCMVDNKFKRNGSSATSNTFLKVISFHYY